MNASDHIMELAVKGRYHFSTGEFARATGSSVNAARASIRRLRKKGLVATPYRGFHVIVPPEYRSIGCLPADQFIGQLMEHLEISYYVALLSAARYHGAAHQQPQVFQVIVKKNRPPIECGRVRVNFVSRRNIDEIPVVPFNTPRGPVLVSSPEATAFDLVGYSAHTGGLDNTASVLTELSESIDPKRLMSVAALSPAPWAQRLGYIFSVIGAEEHADALADYIAQSSHENVSLDPAGSRVGTVREARWKLFVNALLEPDLRFPLISAPGSTSPFHGMSKVPDKHEALALRYAPVLKQKVSRHNPRGDLITRVNMSGDLEGLVDNWAYVSDKRNELPAAGYYSVVETGTHYFILYAFYHGQDWYDGDRLTDKIRKMFDEHLHDMEGALAVVTKRRDEADERVDAFMTISHLHFYCYAGWMKSELEYLYPDAGWENGIRGMTEGIDGGIWPMEDRGRMRFSLYAQAKGHGIRGDLKGWGSEKHIIPYYPSLTESGVPDVDESESGEPWARLFRDVRYRLIDFHEPGGLWENRNNPNVFQENGKGQAAFVILDDNGRVAGSANPPWGWEDVDDRHDCGLIALDPARLVYDYLDGFPEFSLEYIYNPYI